MSSVLVGPNQCGSHTSSMMRPARDDRALLLHEEGQQVELLGRQLQLPFAVPGPAGAGVDADVAALEQRLVRLAGGAAQERRTRARSSASRNGFVT